MYYFYVPDISEGNLFLNEEESRHCIKVLRLGKGDLIYIVDGKGGLYKAEIIKPDLKSCLFSIKSFERKNEHLDFYLHIAIAPTKNIDRFEWFLEKSTEIGIHEITPLICRYSERKTIKQERLQKIIVSAMKQSLRYNLPKLNQPAIFNSFIDSKIDCQKYIAHCQDGNKIHFKDILKEKENSLILIGPEGDFSMDEINRSLEKGFTEINLGKSRLRTETAGIIACHIVNLKNE